MNGTRGGTKARRGADQRGSNQGEQRCHLGGWLWPRTRARASSSLEPRCGRALGTAALGQGNGRLRGERRRGSSGSCRRTNKENGVPRACYRRLNGGQGSPELGFGQRANGAHPSGLRKMCSVQAGRGSAVPSCNVVAGVRVAGVEKLRRRVLLLPFSSPFPSSLTPLFSYLLAAAVKGKTPGWLGFWRWVRGGFIGEALGFMGDPDSKERRGCDGLAGRTRGIIKGLRARVFPGAGGSRARGGNRGRPRGQTRASSGQVAGGRRAPRVVAECRGESRGEARLREEKGKADRRGSPVSDPRRRTGDTG